MTNEVLNGSCLCGEVRYSVSGEPGKFYFCHCNRCRKLSGSGYASNILVETDTIDWSQGEALLGHYKLPDAELFHNRFCTQCGSPMPRLIPEIHMVLIPTGSLDTVPTLRPQAHIFWESRADWSCASDGLPTFAEYPPES